MRAGQKSGSRYIYPSSLTGPKKRQACRISVCLSFKSVGVRRLELPTSTSRTWRAANCATPRAALFATAKLTVFFILRNFFAY